MTDTQKKRGPKPKASRLKAFRLFVMEGMTYAAAGRVMGISRQRVQQLIRPDAAIFNLIRERAKDACEGCRMRLRVGEGHIHHKKKTCTRIDRFNKPRNLLYLCRSCHRNAHHEMKREAWRRKNRRRKHPLVEVFE